MLHECSLRPLHCALVVFGILLLNHVVNGRGTLFSFNGEVDQLWANNFTTVVHDSTRLWIVEFYAAWCGYCQRLAPEFAGFAEDIRTWKPVVGVAAVACSDVSNSALCRTYEVSGFPYVKLFPPSAGTRNRGRPFTGEKTRTILPQVVLNYLNELVSDGRVHSSWPNMNLIRRPSDAWQHGRKEYTYILVEDSNGTTAQNLGLAVILDLLDLSSSVSVNRMSLADAQIHGGARGGGLHGLTLFNQLYPINVGYDRHSIVSEIRRRAGYHLGLSTPSSTTTTTEMDSEMRTPFHRLTDGLHMQDLESSLYYSLWVEVPSRNSFEGSTLIALKQYINVLSKYLPAESHILNFLVQTNNWLKTKHGPLSATDWLTYITTSQNEDAYVPNRVLWTWCRGTRPQFRGYPCSLWMKFHALTVNAYIREIDNVNYSSEEVISSIRGYVDHFLSCRQCAMNFARGSSRLLDGGDTSARYRTRQDGAIMWLWQSHNNANAHLAGDSTEDPLHRKLQFPTRQVCPRCYADGRGDSTWNEEHVLSFLLQYYGASHIIDDDIHDNFSNIGRAMLSNTGATTNQVVPSTTTGTIATTQFVLSTVTGRPIAESLQVTAGPSSRHCQAVSTDWTSCSRTCDVGTSIRVTNDNAECRTEVQVRWCQLRPCLLAFPDWNRSAWHRANCARQGHTYRLGQSVNLQFGNCTSLASEAWKVCGRCPPNNNRPVCCRPASTVTRSLPVVCGATSANNRHGNGFRMKLITSMMVQVIEYCQCDDNCSPDEL